jgi:hypothetical protein|tara:strand:+ start:520 stop:945 length:426 start_codon:yes stop_codon:yes gene_type:complete
MEFAGFCIFLFLMLYGFGKGYRETERADNQQSTPWPYELEDEAYDKVSGESDWDIICRKAIEQARDGNTSARSWVTKHIYEEEEKANTTTPTPKEMIDEAIMALRSLGLNKVDAEKKAAEFGNRKCYDSVEELIQDVFKKE